MVAPSSFNKEIRVSPYLRSFQYGEQNFIYHTCLGNPLAVTPNYANFLDAIGQGGITLDSLAGMDDIRSSIECMLDLKLLELEGDPDFLEMGLKENQKLIPTGKLVKMLVVDVSTRCNMACSYCNVHKTQEKHGIEGGLMTFDLAKTSVDEYIKLAKNAGAKTASISYFGGEPLMNYKVLEPLMRYVHTLKSETSTGLKIFHGLSTNGVLLDDDKVRLLAELDVNVAVSLDGLSLENDKNRVFSNGKGTFWIVEQNIRSLIRIGVETQIVTTISEDNAHAIPAFVDFLAEIGVRKLSLKSCIYKEYKDSDRRDVYDAILNGVNYAREKGLHAVEGPGVLDYTRGCQGLGGMLCVEPSGDVFACPEGIRIKLGEAKTLSEIPLSPEYNYIASRITGNLPECKGCDVEGLCRGGCAGESEYRFDDIYAINKSACDSIRKNIKRNLAIRAGFSQ
jgi:uncharacterized protein